MPTLLIDGVLRFFYFSNEGNEPPHVHVEAGDAAAKFWLDPVRLAANHGLKQKDLARAKLLVEQHRTDLLERWHAHFDA